MQVLTKSLIYTVRPATERLCVFFSCAFFYDMVSGYIPCPKAGIECAMPTARFPEFEKPLGPPDGPAIKKGLVYA